MLAVRTISVAVAVLIATTPAIAQKSKDTLRIGFYDPIPGVDLVYDPKGETSLTARAVFDTLISYNERTGQFEPTPGKVVEMDQSHDLRIHSA